MEINCSYRPPTPEQVERMCRKVPTGFGFSFKGRMSASHGRDNGELAMFRSPAERAAAAGKLLSLVVQFPESFPNSAPARTWLIRVRELLRPYPLAVEFRHISWDMPALPGWAARHDLDVAWVGLPDLPALFPAGPRAGGPRVYARLHSQEADNWYSDGTARYDYDYPEPALQRWADGLCQAATAGAGRALLFFNNCVSTQAVNNAKRLIQLLTPTDTLRVIAPPAAGLGQGLFDAVPD